MLHSAPPSSRSPIAALTSLAESGLMTISCMNATFSNTEHKTSICLGWYYASLVVDSCGISRSAAPPAEGNSLLTRADVTKKVRASRGSTERLNRVEP